MASNPKTNPNETITQFTDDFLEEEQRKMNEYYDSQRQRPRNFSMDIAAAAVSNPAAVSDPASAADYNIRRSPITIPEGYQDTLGQGTMLADHAGDFDEIPSDIAREIMVNPTTTASLLPKVEEGDLLPFFKNKATDALNKRATKRRKKEQGGGRKSRTKRRKTKSKKTKRRKRKSRRKRTKRRKRKSRRKR